MKTVNVDITSEEVSWILATRRAESAILTQEIAHISDKLEAEIEETAYLSTRVGQLAGDLRKEREKRCQMETVTGTKYSDPALVSELLKNVFGNNKINTIKAVRSLTGIGLKEAKSLVEQHWKAFHSVTFTPYPDSQQPFPRATNTEQV